MCETLHIYWVNSFPFKIGHRIKKKKRQSGHSAQLYKGAQLYKAAKHAAQYHRIQFLTMKVAVLFSFLLPTYAGWKSFSGFIPAGDDVSALPPGTSVAAAKAACAAVAPCAGFTYVGAPAGPSAGT